MRFPIRDRNSEIHCSDGQDVHRWWFWVSQVWREIFRHHHFCNLWSIRSIHPNTGDLRTSFVVDISIWRERWISAQTPRRIIFYTCSKQPKQSDPEPIKRKVWSKYRPPQCPIRICSVSSVFRLTTCVTTLRFVWSPSVHRVRVTDDGSQPVYKILIIFDPENELPMKTTTKINQDFETV